VKKVGTGRKGVPFLVTHDARTIRYPDPDIKVHDTVMVDIASGKIKQFIKFEPGQTCMVTGGGNLGRVGTFMHRNRHSGSFDIVEIKDKTGQSFATRLDNVFVLGKPGDDFISIPKGNGIKLSIAQERDARLAKK